MRDRTSDQVTAAFQNTKPLALHIHPRSGTLTISEEVDATTDALVLKVVLTVARIRKRAR
jgi:hypothetical protein